MIGRMRGANSWNRFAASSGAGSILLSVVALIVAGTNWPPTLQASTSDVANFIGDAEPAREWVAAYISFLGMLLLLVFGAYLSSLLRVARDSLDPLAFGALIVSVALAIASSVAFAPLLNR